MGWNKVLLLLCSVFICMPLRAQLIKVEAGIALSAPIVTEYNERNTGESGIGFQGGIRLDIPLSHMMSLQPGLLFVQTTAGLTTIIPPYGKTPSAQTTTLNRTGSLQLPVSLVFRFNTGSDSKVMFGSGAYASYGLYGKQWIMQEYPSYETSASISFGNAARDTYKRMDYGICFISGIELKSGLTINGYYSYGMFNRNPVAASPKKIKNQQFALTVGCYLNRKIFIRKRVPFPA